MTIIYLACSALTIKKNGPIHNGKKHHQCLACGRQCILNPEKKRVPEERKEKLAKHCLRESLCLARFFTQRAVLRPRDHFVIHLRIYLDKSECFFSLAFSSILPLMLSFVFLHETLKFGALLKCKMSYNH